MHTHRPKHTVKHGSKSTLRRVPAAYTETWLSSTHRDPSTEVNYTGPDLQRPTHTQGRKHTHRSKDIETDIHADDDNQRRKHTERPEQTQT